MNIQPITIKKHLFEQSRYNLPKRNLIINPNMNNSKETNQEEEQENLNIGNPPKKFDIKEYLENISEQCMLQAYKTQSFPTIKFEVGGITQNANPISKTQNNEMTFALPEGYDENEAKQIIMDHCRNGVTLKDRSNNVTEYTVKLEPTNFDTIDEAAQKARELNVEDEENYRRAILFDETPMFLKVVGYNSKQNQVQKPDPSDFSDDLDDSTQDSDYDDPVELQNNKYIAGILYGMHNGLEQNTLINGVPQFQIEKPATEDNLDLETIALYGLSLRLNTAFGYYPPFSLAVRKNKYQRIYNKLILQDYENDVVIKLIAKLDLAYQIYMSYNNHPEQNSLFNYFTQIEDHIINRNDIDPSGLQNLDFLITQKLQEVSEIINETLYPAYKTSSKIIVDTNVKNNLAQLADLPISYLIHPNNYIPVNINSVPIIPLNHKFNYANVEYKKQLLQPNSIINYNEMNSPHLYPNQNTNLIPPSVSSTQITTTNNPLQTTITYQPNTQELVNLDNNIINETTQNQYGTLNYQENIPTTNNTNDMLALNNQITQELDKYINNQNIQTTTTATTTEIGNSNTNTIPVNQFGTSTFTNSNTQIYNNQYIRPNNAFSQNNHINAFAAETQLDSDLL